MARDRSLIVSLTATVVVLLLFVSASFRASRLKKGFREEMAQRLDLEEKLLAFENRQKGFLEQLEILKRENNGLKEERSSLKAQLLREQREKAAFKGALQKAEAQLRIRTEVAAASPGAIVPAPSKASSSAGAAGRAGDAGEKSVAKRGETLTNFSSASAVKPVRKEFSNGVKDSR